MYVDMNSWPSEQLQIKTLRHMCLISAARGGGGGARPSMFDSAASL